MLRVFQNKILMQIFGPLKDKNEEWKELHSEELHNLILSSNIVRRIKTRRLIWAGHIARIEEGGNVFRILTGIHREKRLLGKSRRRGDNIRMDIKGLGINKRSWVDSAQNRIIGESL